MNQHKVVITGQILGGFERDAVVVALARLIRREPVMAERLLSGRAVTVKANVDRTTAERYAEALRTIGVQARAESDELDFELDSPPAVAAPTLRADAEGRRPATRGAAPAAAPAPPSSVPPPSGEVASPPLWNPNAASLWGLLLTPMFSSYLVARNWDALNEPAQGRRERSWLVVMLLITAILWFVADATGKEKLVGLAGLAILLIWNFVRARPQVAFVKARYGKEYVRRPWIKAIAVGLFCVVGAATLIGTVAGALESAGPDLAKLNANVENINQQIKSAAREPPFKAEAGLEMVRGYGRGEPLPVLKITATEDKVTLQDVSVNRGTCAAMTLFFDPNLPRDLKFGETARFVVLDCRILEAKIKTDRGTFTMKWE